MVAARQKVSSTHPEDVGKMADPLALVAQEFVSSTPLLCFDECHVLNVGDALLMCSFFKHLFKAAVVG